MSLDTPLLVQEEDDAKKEADVQEDPQSFMKEQLSDPVSYGMELRRILDQSWPVALATLCRMLVYNTDTAMVGHLGTLQLTGVSLAQSFNQIVGVFGWGPAYVLNSICSQAIGAGNPKLAGNWFQLAIVICLVVSLVVCAFYACMVPFVRFLFHGEDERCHDDPESGDASRVDDVIRFATEYQMVAWAIYTPTLVYMALRQLFQAMQVVRPASVVSGLTVGVNFALNYLLVFGVSGAFDGLGVRGSATATLLSMIFQLTAFLSYAVLWKKYHKPYWGGWTLDSFQRHRVRRFLRLTMPMVVGIALEQWGYEVITLLSGRLCGHAIVSTNAIFYNIWMIMWSFYWGFGLALQTRVAYHLGGGRVRSVQRVIRLSVGIVAVVIVCAGTVLFTLRHDIPRLFSSDPDVLKLFAKYTYVVIANFGASCLSLCAVNVLEGTGRTKELAIIQGIGTWGVQIPCAVYFAFYYEPLRHGDDALLGLWLGMLIGESAKGLASWTCLCRTNWDEQAQRAKDRSEASTSKQPHPQSPHLT